MSEGRVPRCTASKRAHACDHSAPHALPGLSGALCLNVHSRAWHFMRVREDKSTPNAKSVADNVKQSIEDGIEQAELLEYIRRIAPPPPPKPAAPAAAANSAKPPSK